MAKNKTFKVRVGTIGSVLDMMRYDQCFPSTEEDACKLSKILGVGARPSPEDHVVSFTTANRSSMIPTRARWESFGCEVLED